MLVNPSSLLRNSPRFSLKLKLASTGDHSSQFLQQMTMDWRYWHQDISWWLSTCSFSWDGNYAKALCGDSGRNGLQSISQPSTIKISGNTTSKIFILVMYCWWRRTQPYQPSGPLAEWLKCTRDWTSLCVSQPSELPKGHTNDQLPNLLFLFPVTKQEINSTPMIITSFIHSCKIMDLIGRRYV